MIGECTHENKNEDQPCAGSLCEERAQNVDLVNGGCKGLPSCDCCDACRLECEKSWWELFEEEKLNPKTKEHGKED